MLRTVAVLVMLAVGALAAAAPLPRVFATYSSWPQGAYRFRDIQVPLFEKLGWPYDHRENTDLAALLADLDRYDIFAAPSLYNYDHAVPFEQHTEQWRAFLERGGIILAPDANYGQMTGWLGRLGTGLELQPSECGAGMKGQGPVQVVAPDDPAAPPPLPKCPWGHFASHGSGWKVLATCPEGKAICLRADIGKGAVIATTLYDEGGFPTAEYLARLWQAQWPRLMAQDPVTVERGPAGVGRKTITVKLAAALSGRLVLETRRGGQWRTQAAALPAQGQEVRLPAHAGEGTSDYRLVVETGGVRTWWTGWTERVPETAAQAGEAGEHLVALQEALAGLPTDHPLRRRGQELAALVAQTSTAAQTLLQAEAGPETARSWQELSARLTALEAERKALAGRAAIAGRAAPDRAFAVVRCGPLTKVFREEAPPGPLEGGVRLRAARGEADSAQVAIVPLRGDLSDVRAYLEPFTDGSGKPLAVDTELHRVCYVHLPEPSSGVPPGRTWWPDPLLPADKPFAVRYTAQPLWLDLWAPRGGRAGRYRGALVVEAAGQTERVPLTLEVLDFTLPREHGLRQVFVFRAPQITQRYHRGGDYKLVTPVDTYLRMADVCLKRRVGVQAFGQEQTEEPVSVMAYLGERKTAAGWQFDFTQADRVWQHQWDSGLRTLFVGFTPGCGGLYEAAKKEDYWIFLEAYLKALVPHLKEKGWYESAVWYMVDECWQEEAVQANLRLAALMDRLAPGLKRLMTAPRDARLYGKCAIWVPGGLPEAHPQEEASRSLLEGWAPFDPERWWYICCGPVHPYPNFFADYPAVDARVVFWLTWKYGKTGFLYWGVECQGDPREMTADGPTEKYSLGPARMGNGDGGLCYWGPQEQFYPSVRLNAIRDGLEDYECFLLARRLAAAAEQAGKAPQWVARARRVLAVDKAVIAPAEASPNFTYSLEPGPLLAARRELDECIVGLQEALRQGEAGTPGGAE